MLDENETGQLDTLVAESRFVPLTVTYEPLATTRPTMLGLPRGACVVSANKNVGFGQTGTQEEMQVGSSPECCPIVLFVPPLQDNQVLVVEGAEAMISMKGYGREACLDRVLVGDYDNHSGGLHQPTWRQRTMLFMDALELDLSDATGIVPDLLPGHVNRELLKAYIAFSSKTRPERYTEIVTGLWGCGSFGGNRDIKAILQWCAASMAETPLIFVCSGVDQADFAINLKHLVEKGLALSWRVKDVLGLLHSLRPEDADSQMVFSYVLRCLGSQSR
jgi:poly(ADP-ribose) glycohydrolase